MPLGISFYTFKNISYVVDVYQEKVDVQYNPLLYFDYACFFPCIVAGPINRSKEFFEELKDHSQLEYKDAKNGGIQMLLGIFEKVVFSDYLAIVANNILNNSEIVGMNAVLGIALYSFVIYLSKSAKIYTRKYTKLLDALGNVLSIMSGIMLTFKFISRLFTEAYQDKEIVKTTTETSDNGNSELTPDEKLSEEIKEIFNTNNEIDENSSIQTDYFRIGFFNTVHSIPDSKKSKTAKLKISKIDIKCDEVSLEPITKQYDGKSVEIKPTGYVPEGVHYNVVIKDSSGTVVQDPVNAGVYNVEVNFTSDKNHSVQPQKLETTLTINKRVVDLSNVEYGLEEVTFDGTIRRYSLLDQYTNQYVTPKFTYLRYETDEECEPSTGGKYKVLIDYEAIDGDMSNYELVNVPTDPAILIINKKAIDLGNLVYGPEEVKYDGTSKKYTYFDSRVPAYVVPKLTYYALGSDEPCNPIEPGTYTVVVNFEIVESEKANLELIHVPTKSTELIITDISE